MGTDVAEETYEVIEELGKARKDKADCSHRVIEKRRRDRINNSLLQLSKLVPVEQFNKKNSAKLEKAEVLEVTVQYLMQQQEQRKEQEEVAEMLSVVDTNADSIASFLNGFKECVTDATRFFQEVEELDVSEGRCHRLIQHLKKQVQRFENSEKAPSKGDDGVWEGDDAKKNYKANSVIDSPGNTQWKVRPEGLKRKIDEGTQGNTKRQRSDKTQRPSNHDSSGSGCESDISSSSVESTNGAAATSNMFPFMFPHLPFFPAFSYPGANNGMPRYPTPQSQFQSYPFSQSPYIPVPVPQFPYMGVNMMPGFGMVNPASDQQPQNHGMNSTNGHDMQDGMTNGAPSGVVNGMMNSFLPSMYSNGLYANLMAVRPRDSGYDSSDRSSSSKESRNENSPQSSSDDSCHSFSVT